VTFLHPLILEVNDIAPFSSALVSTIPLIFTDFFVDFVCSGNE